MPSRPARAAATARAVATDTHDPVTTVTSVLQRVAAVLRRIIGAPDYDGYVAHMQRCHPDREPVSKATFEQQRLEDRYNRPGSRCC